MTKITEQEIEKVKGLRVKFDQLVNTIGQVEVQLYNLREQKKELQVSLLNIQQEELTLAKELEEKYGKGTVSLDTGEFSPTE